MKKITKKVDTNKLLVKSLVDLWYETQMGNIHKCREKQLEFSDFMWSLYEEFYPEGEDKKENEI